MYYMHTIPSNCMPLIAIGHRVLCIAHNTTMVSFSWSKELLVQECDISWYRGVISSGVSVFPLKKFILSCGQMLYRLTTFSCSYLWLSLLFLIAMR